MKQTLAIVDALKEEVARLEKVLAVDIKVGDKPPGETQIERIKALISDLKREIDINTPRP
jgi:ferredoxin-NADP reductase